MGVVEEGENSGDVNVWLDVFVAVRNNIIPGMCRGVQRGCRS